MTACLRPATKGMQDNKQAGPRYAQPRRYTPLVPRPEGGALVTIMPPAPDPSPEARRVPTSVYRYYDSYDVLLYVGITSRGMARNMEHNHSKEWFPFVVRQEVEHHKSRGAALNRENQLIRRFQPPFNKQGNPAHERAREAYYLFRESPRAARQEFIQPHKRAGKLPRTMWFRSGELLNGEMRLELASLAGGKWTFAPPAKIAVKNHRRKPVGRLVNAHRGIDGLAYIDVTLLPGPVPSGITVTVKWPPIGGFTCAIVSLEAAYDGGL